MFVASSSWRAYNAHRHNTFSIKIIIKWIEEILGVFKIFIHNNVPDEKGEVNYYCYKHTNDEE